MSEREELTERDRDRLDQKGERKALRIIDAHAADRAALVAQVAELEREVERLTCIPCDADKRVAESEVARLREALEAEKRESNAAFCLEVQLRQAAEAQVRELDAELAAANALMGRIPDCLLTDCPVYADLSEYKRAHLSARSGSK